MGDAPNDKELLTGSDLSIAVGKGTAINADFFIDNGEAVTLKVLSYLE